MNFLKMTGSGNDFIVIDNRDNIVIQRKKTAVMLCDRKFGIGADGLLLLETSQRADFRMRIFNPDGSEAAMCGNGLRCIMRVASEKGIANSKSMKVETKAGILTGTVSKRKVKAQLKIIGNARMDINIPVEGKNIIGHFLNTGVPHTVIFTDDINSPQVNKTGAVIRYHQIFKPEGTNIDWIEVADKHRIKIRTYERGVEGETLSCGTGSVAGAIISFLTGKTTSPVKVTARSGETLTVYFDSSLETIYLEGIILHAFNGTWVGR